ncbi:hypothetical protein PENSPDRAFT_758216 [Peniophora sp. CONT]|nr:hypothetical protein PENSPDRAFT_758216 [Peniophora sp. CONT]
MDYDAPVDLLQSDIKSRCAPRRGRLLSAARFTELAKRQEDTPRYYKARLNPTAKGGDEVIIKLGDALRAVGASDIVRLSSPHRGYELRMTPAQRDAFLKGYRDRQTVSILPDADRQEAPHKAQVVFQPNRTFIQSEQTLSLDSESQSDYTSTLSMQTTQSPQFSHSSRHQRLQALQDMAKRLSQFVRHGKKGPAEL